MYVVKIVHPKQFHRPTVVVKRPNVVSEDPMKVQNTKVINSIT